MVVWPPIKCVTFDTRYLPSIFWSLPIGKNWGWINDEGMDNALTTLKSWVQWFNCNECNSGKYWVAQMSEPCLATRSLRCDSPHILFYPPSHPVFFWSYFLCGVSSDCPVTALIWSWGTCLNVVDLVSGRLWRLPDGNPASWSDLHLLLGVWKFFLKHARTCISHVPERELSTTDYIRREAMESPNKWVSSWLVGGTKYTQHTYNICIVFRNRISFESTTLNEVEWKEQKKNA